MDICLHEAKARQESLSVIFFGRFACLPSVNQQMPGWQQWHCKVNSPRNSSSAFHSRYTLCLHLFFSISFLDYLLINTLPLPLPNKTSHQCVSHPARSTWTVWVRKLVGSWRGKIHHFQLNNYFKILLRASVSHGGFGKQTVWEGSLLSCTKINS